MNRNSSVLVTGATGFIGRKLCDRLRGEGVRVRAMSRLKAQGPWDECVACDLDGPVPESCLRGIDTVFHLAGRAHALSDTYQDDACYERTNVQGTLRLLAAARAHGVRRFVYFSSVKVMGEGGEQELNESEDCRPTTAYGRSKLEAERLVISGGYVPEPVVLRLSMVYGKTSKGNLPRMIQAVASGRFPPLPEVGNRRSMVHVLDVVGAALLAARKQEAKGNIFIVTDGQSYSTRQIYEWICVALGKSPPRWTVPVCLMRLLARGGDSIGALRGRRFMFDSDALEKLIGSAWYSSAKIEKELGFVASRDLSYVLPELVAYLELQ